MARTVEILQERESALLSIVDRIPGGIDGISCARNEDLLDLLAITRSLILTLDGVLAATAGEISRRSAQGSESSLAKQHGESSARTLIAHRGGMTFGEAARLVDVGEAIRSNQALSGEDLPADRPHIAAAVLAGELPLLLAKVIDETLEKLGRVLTGPEAFEMEQVLVEQACSGMFSVQDFIAYCKGLPNKLDQDGAEPRDKHLRDKASFTQTKLSNGLLRIIADLDPERAAYFLAAMDARTNPRRENGEADTSRRGAEQRTQPTREQSRLDAFVSILRAALKADNGSQAGVDTTVLVRIDLADLLSGVGTATIDGVDTPISAASARRMAAEADVISQVFSGKSVLLDQGESKRVFTKAQRYAILAMFVGCAFPKCDMPSSMIEIHHIGRWASRGEHRCGTDLLNGIPLCGFHNRLMEEGWDIEFDADRIPWFIPPATLDPTRTPIRGGNLAGERAA